MKLLPNTAACFTADEAIRTARLGRELDMGDLVKLEVIGDRRTLFPDVEGLVAGREGAREGGLHGAARTRTTIPSRRRSSRTPAARR